MHADPRHAAARAAGYTVHAEMVGDPGAGPSVTYEKDGIFLSLYRDKSARLYTGVGMVYMSVGPFPFPGPDFAGFEGQLVCAKLGAESLLGGGQ